MVGEAVPRLRNNRAHLVVAEDSSPHSGVDVPNAEKIVIAATRQLLSVGAPLESTYLLSVALVGAHDALTCRDSDVVVMDLRIN